MATFCVAGASGFIGTYLVQRWRDVGHNVVTIGRSLKADHRWGDDLRPVLDRSDVLINLAGRSVSCRYNKKNVDTMFSSRIQTTSQLGKALEGTTSPPEVWMNASSATIYQEARDRPQTEADGEAGAGMSVGLASLWERTFFDVPVDVRKVALRMSIVLGHGGAFNPLVNMTRLGLGGRMGDGKQMFSWIHIEDIARSVDFAVHNKGIAGPLNIAAPEAVSNTELMKTMREVLGKDRGVPSPVWLLEFGGRIIRTEPELVLKSRWVKPGVLLDEGFEWEYPSLRGALQHLAKDIPKMPLPVQLG